MITQQMYSIYDEKAQAFITPFFLPNDALAMRAFKLSVADPGHQFNRSPFDFTLFKVGEFHITEGQVTSFKSPISVMTGLAATQSITFDNQQQQQLFQISEEEEKNNAE